MMHIQKEHREAILRHLGDNAIRSCTTCGCDNMEPIYYGRLQMEPAYGNNPPPSVVLVACKGCGRILMFSADQIKQLPTP